MDWIIFDTAAKRNAVLALNDKDYALEPRRIDNPAHQQLDNYALPTTLITRQDYVRFKSKLDTLTTVPATADDLFLTPPLGPAVWRGLGLNYKALEANWAADMAIFRSLGIHFIRPSLADSVTPWTAGTPSDAGSGNVAYWRKCALAFQAAGFNVSYGLSGVTGINPITASNWPTYRAAILAEAAYLQSLGVKFHAFEIGNELEPIIDGTTITKAGLAARLGALATDVKAVYSGRVSYGVYDRDGDTFTTWVATGLGGLDEIGMHLYPNTNAGAVNNPATAGNLANAGAMMAAFTPLHCSVTEFNLDSNPSKIPLLTDAARTAGMTALYTWLRSTLGASRAYAYSYVGTFGLNNDFAMVRTDGSKTPEWDVVRGTP